MQTQTASMSGKRKASENSEEQNNSSAAAQITQDTYASKPRKKAKTLQNKHGKSGSTSGQKGKVKAVSSIYRGRNVGKLANLLEMPMDIFCEICQHLDPLDLFQLSRSSKSFHRILTSRDSKPIWRAARRAYPNLPECPEDLSEPEYARLVFTKECHVCLTGRIQSVNYELRTRLCRHCQSLNILRGDALLKAVSGLTEELLECLPSKYSWHSKGSCRFRPFYKGSAERIVVQYIKAVPPTLSYQEAAMAKAEFIKSKKALLSQIQAHSRELSQWSMNQAFAKRISDNEATKRRQEAIRTKLLALGHAEEDILPHNHNAEWDSIFQQPRDLTPRIWNKVRPKLERIIAEYAVYRKEQDMLSRRNVRRQELRSYLLRMLANMTANDPKFNFPVDSAIELPTCVAIVEENDCRNQITQQKWLEVKEQVLAEARDATEKFEQSLISSITSLKQIPKSLTIPESVDREFLSATSTYFICGCGFYQRYPQLRNHICHVSDSVFVFDTSRTTAAQAILAALPEGEDADSIKTKEFKCNVCSARLPWPNVIFHFYPEGMKHRHAFSYYTNPTPNAHILEEVVDKFKPLFTVNETHYESDSGYDEDEYYGYEHYGGLSDSDDHAGFAAYLCDCMSLDLEDFY